jgi:hypothetical protein
MPDDDAQLAATLRDLMPLFRDDRRTAKRKERAARKAIKALNIYEMRSAATGLAKMVPLDGADDPVLRDALSNWAAGSFNVWDDITAGRSPHTLDADDIFNLAGLASISHQKALGIAWVVGMVQQHKEGALPAATSEQLAKELASYGIDIELPVSEIQGLLHQRDDLALYPLAPASDGA